jgi:hypothetical protein
LSGHGANSVPHSSACQQTKIRGPNGVYLSLVHKSAPQHKLQR